MSTHVSAGSVRVRERRIKFDPDAPTHRLFHHLLPTYQHRTVCLYRTSYCSGGVHLYRYHYTFVGLKTGHSEFGEFDNGGSLWDALSGNCAHRYTYCARRPSSNLKYYILGPVELAAHTVVVPTHPLRLPFLPHAPNGDAHASIHRSFSLLPISRPATPRTSEGCPRYRVSAAPTSKLPVD